MARKSKNVVEAQFDENGNPVNVQEERPIVRRKIDSQLRAMIEASAMFASRPGDEKFEVGQWGNKPFSNIEVVLIAERLDVPCTVNEARAVLKKMVEDGFLSKPKGAKKYTYNPEWESKYNDMKAEIEALKSMRPTQAQ